MDIQVYPQERMRRVKGKKGGKSAKARVNNVKRKILK